MEWYNLNISEAVVKRILELCRERNITINKLSTICGITQSTLSNIVNRESNNPTVSTIKKICDGLEITIVDFFNTEDFLNLEQEIKWQAQNACFLLQICQKQKCAAVPSNFCAAKIKLWEAQEVLIYDKTGRAINLQGFCLFLQLFSQREKVLPSVT